MTQYAFETLGLNRVDILCDLANTRSAKVPQRICYHFEGVRRDWYWHGDHPIDCEVYYMLALDIPIM